MATAKRAAERATWKLRGFGEKWFEVWDRKKVIGKVLVRKIGFGVNSGCRFYENFDA